LHYELDELDSGIIRHLSVDGRMSFKDLACKLNVTEKTVRLRYKSLIEKEILNVVGIVDPLTVGIKAGAIILIKVHPKSIETVVKDLQEIKWIRYISLISGKYQLLIQIAVKDQKKITDTIILLNDNEKILEINSIVQLDVYKNTFEFI